LNKNCPTLRFPQYSEKWDNTILGKVSSFSKGKGLSKNDMSSDGKILCIRYGELYTHYTEVIKDVISRTNVSSDELVFSEANDIIIPSSGETPEDIATASCIIDSGIAIGGDLNIIKTNNNGIFISYYLNNKRKYQIANLSQGKSVVHLYADQLYTLEINIPSLPEQQKIASFLTTVDEKLQALKKKKTLLEQYKKGVMQKIFSQEIRFKPALSEVEGDDNGKEYPEWEGMTLGDVAEITMGQSPDSKSYNTIGLGKFLIQGNADISKRKSNPRYWSNNPIRECDIGDILLTVRAPVGAIAKSVHNACIGRGVCAIKNNEKSIMEYLYQFLLEYENKWVRLEQGSTFTAVSRDDIRSIEINIPNISEQTKIANFLTAIDDKINHCQTQIDKTEMWKKGLLQRMFC